MSLKPDMLSAPAETQSSVFLTKVIESNNVCSVNRTDSDSESWWDSLAASGERNVERFWSKVNTAGPVPAHMPHLGACWLFTGGIVRGHGQFVAPRDIDGQPHVYAHRFAFAVATGLVPSPDIKICHKCDNGLCVRPSHLFPGTQADNLSDARSKGRLVCGKHLIKVDDVGLEDIRANYRPRVNGKQLAAKYGISLVHLLRLVRGTGRVHVEKVIPSRSVPQCKQVVGEVA